MVARMSIEEIREFFVRRPWLHEQLYREVWVLSAEEYQSLKARTLVFTPERQRYLEAFIDGWKWAKS